MILAMILKTSGILVSTTPAGVLKNVDTVGCAPRARTGAHAPAQSHGSDWNGLARVAPSGFAFCIHVVRVAGSGVDAGRPARRQRDWRWRRPWRWRLHRLDLGRVHFISRRRGLASRCALLLPLGVVVDADRARDEQCDECQRARSPAVPLGSEVG